MSEIVCYLFGTLAECREPLKCTRRECGNEPCLPDGTPLYPRRKPTREEKLQALADSGIDTWEEYRGER